MRLVLVGPPGAGKGTQAEFIAAELGVPKISTGDIFRFNVAEGTPLGLEAKSYMDAGSLVPDDVTNKMVADRLAEDDVAEGFLLDGYPRNIDQAEVLDGHLAELNSAVDVVLELAADDDEVIRRLSGRRVSRSTGKVFHLEFDPPEDPNSDDLYQRDDDRSETVAKRLKVYAEQTAPLVDFYRQQNKLVRIDALGAVSDVTKRAMQSLRQHVGKLGQGMFRRRLDIQYKTTEQFTLMREAGLVVAAVHEAMRNAVAPGASTGELDGIAEDIIRSHKAEPSFLGYDIGAGPYPGSICASVNDQVVHAIPSDDVTLVEGDVISIDVGAVLNGWHGDAAITLPVGRVSAEVTEMIEVCENALWAGIRAAASSKRLGGISNAVESSIEAAGTFGIVEGFGGHGIGTEMHQDPHVLNYGPPHSGPKLRSGMALAIEPMITLGSPDTAELDDNWTIVTADGSLAAHTEHSIAICDDGLWVLTAPDGGVEALGELASDLARNN